MLLFLASYRLCANQTAKNLVLFTSPIYNDSDESRDLQALPNSKDPGRGGSM